MLCRFFVGKGSIMNNLMIAAADNNQEIMDFLQKFQDWIQHANIWTWIWKNVLWAFVRGLYTLSSLAEKSVDSILTLGGFLDYGPIKNIYIAMQLIAASILAIMLVVIGYKKIFNMPVKIKQATIQLILVSVLMVELPGLMTWGLNVSKQFFNESKTAGNTIPNNSSLSFSIIKDNTTDLAYVASTDFKALEEGNTIVNAPGQTGVIIPEKNPLTEEMFKQITMSDVIIPKDAKKLGMRGKYLGYQISYDYDGKIEATEIENGFLDMFKEGVFRYPAQFPTIIMGEITLGLAYLMALFVLAQSMVELAFKKILFPLVAASDIETGQRTKVYLQDIFQTLMVIPLTGISLRVFTIFYAYVATLGMNWFLTAIASIVGMLVCMNGTNTIAKHFGVDVGVKDGMKGMLMMMAAGKLGKDLVSGTGKTVKSVANKGIEATEEGYKQAKKSIRDTKDTLDNGAKKVGQNVGQLSERGISGFITDKKEAMKESAAAKKQATQEKMDNAIGKVTKPVTDVKENFKKGVDTGIVDGASKNSKETKASDSIRNDEKRKENPIENGKGTVVPAKEASYSGPQDHRGETNRFGNTKVTDPKTEGEGTLSTNASTGVRKSLSELKVEGSTRDVDTPEKASKMSTTPNSSTSGTTTKSEPLQAKVDGKPLAGNSPAKMDITIPTTGEKHNPQQQVINVRSETSHKQDVQQVTNQANQVTQNQQSTNQQHIQQQQTKQETVQRTETTHNQTLNHQSTRSIDVNTGGRTTTGRSTGHGEFSVNFDDLFDRKE